MHSKMWGAAVQALVRRRDKSLYRFFDFGEDEGPGIEIFLSISYYGDNRQLLR